MQSPIPKYIRRWNIETWKFLKFNTRLFAADTKGRRLTISISIYANIRGKNKIHHGISINQPRCAPLTHSRYHSLPVGAGKYQRSIGLHRVHKGTPRETTLEQWSGPLRYTSFRRKFPCAWSTSYIPSNIPPLFTSFSFLPALVPRPHPSEHKENSR